MIPTKRSSWELRPRNSKETCLRPAIARGFSWLMLFDETVRNPYHLAKVAKAVLKSVRLSMEWAPIRLWSLSRSAINVMLFLIVCQSPPQPFSFLSSTDTIAIMYNIHTFRCGNQSITLTGQWTYPSRLVFAILWVRITNIVAVCQLWCKEEALEPLGARIHKPLFEHMWAHCKITCNYGNPRKEQNSMSWFTQMHCK